MPDRLICRPVRMFHPVRQPVVLSPDQVWAYAECQHAGAGDGEHRLVRAVLALRLEGGCVISRPPAGASVQRYGCPKPAATASSSRIAYSLLSFQPRDAAIEDLGLQALLPPTHGLRTGEVQM
jgi:hypothetical protein